MTSVEPTWPRRQFDELHKLQILTVEEINLPCRSIAFDRRLDVLQIVLVVLVVQHRFTQLTSSFVLRAILTHEKLYTLFFNSVETTISLHTKKI